MKLTGRTRYRHAKPMFGRPLLVLQVEETGYEFDHAGGYIDSRAVTRWRDATLEDVQVEVAA